MREDEIGPFGHFAARGAGTADGLAEGTHPFVFLRGRVGVEVDGFAVGEAEAEPLFDELVAFVFFGEGGFAAFLGGGVGCVGVGDQGGLVVDELGGFGEVDGCAGLHGVFVVGGKAGGGEAEEAATPVLRDVS